VVIAIDHPQEEPREDDPDIHLWVMWEGVGDGSARELPYLSDVP
jgi:hypothetical protein